MDIVNFFDLQLFAEGAATAATGTAAGSTGDGTTGNVSAESDTAVTTKSKRKAKTDPFANVKFGKQASNPEAVADAGDTNAEGNAEGKGNDTTSSVTANAATPSPQGEGSEDGVTGEGETTPKTYTEEEYKQALDRELKRRYKAKDKAMEPILRYASEALGVDIGDVDAMSKAADAARKQRYQDEAGRTGNNAEEIERNADNAYNVRNYRQELDSIKQASEAEAFNARMSAQEASVKEAYPDFNFEKEISNPKFRNLLKAGFEMKNAYESVHYAELVADARASAFREAKEQVSASVAAGARRPMEGGAVNPSAQIISDPKLLTKEQRSEIKRRVRRGEKIIW